MATLLWHRDIASNVNDAKTTFSSWDNCISKAYCKWPVIVAIIIGSIIALSALWCLFRCVCLGAECCCGCMSCCTSCCPSGGRRRHGHQPLQSAPPPAYPPQPITMQYQPPAPMSPAYAQPQYAQFDAPSKRGGAVNEDALPAMPSWQTAQSRRVEVEGEVPEPNEAGDIQMDRLDRNGRDGANVPMLANAANRPLRSPMQAGPGSPYGHTSPLSERANFVGGDLGDRSQYYHQHGPGGYGGASPTTRPGLYGAQAYGGARGNGHASPAYTTNQDQYMQRSYGRGQYPGQGQYAGHTSPTAFSPSGSTRYEPSFAQQPQSPYSEPQVSRKPVQGSWRDI